MLVPFTQYINAEANLKRLSRTLSLHPAAALTIFSAYIQQHPVVRDVDLRNSILEHLLSSASQPLLADPEAVERILSLAGPDNYNHALQLAQLHNFPPLVVHVLREQKRTEDLLRYLLKEGNIDDVVECCGEEA